jgi:hypothetical protein
MSSSHNLIKATSEILYVDQGKLIKTLTSVALPCLLVFGLLFRIFFMGRHVIDLKKKMTYHAVFLTDE